MMESLLYAVLEEEERLPNSNRDNQIKFKAMISSAKKGENPIISKDLYNKLDELNDLRDLLHPKKQEDLHTQKFSVEKAKMTKSVVFESFEEVKDYYGRKWIDMEGRYIDEMSEANSDW